MPIFSSGGQFGGGLQNPQFGGNMPQFPWSESIKNTYGPPWKRRPRQQFGSMNYFQQQMGNWGGPQTINTPQINQGQTNQYLQGGTQGINAPNISNQWQQYLGKVGNVTAPNMNNAQMNQYLKGGTQAINAAGLQDTSALLKSYDPILQQQQEQGFSQAAMRAGKTGMWGSPYSQALGAEAGKASNQRANIANQYLYQASEQAANRQLQAEIQNRQNQLQAAGMSAEQARAQAQMELSAAQGNQQTGLGAAQLAGQMGSQQAQMQLQAQIQDRQNQLQAAGLSAQQAQAQAQLEMQGQMANQSTNQQYYGQLLQGLGQAQNYNLGQGQLSLQQQQERNRQMQNMMEQYQGIFGDILSPDELWKFINQSYGGGGYTIPQTGPIEAGNFGGNYGGGYGGYGYGGW